MALGRLVKKEVVAVLKSPAFATALIVVVVYFVVLGRAVGVATEQVAREALEAVVGVVVEDGDPLTARVLAVANATLGGKLLTTGSVEEGLRRFPAVVVIPEAFGASLLDPGATAYVRGYVTLERVSALQGARAESVARVAALLGEVARRLIAAERGIDVAEMGKPVSVMVEAVVGSRVLDLGSLSSLLLSTTVFAILVGLLGLMTLMYSAQAVAGEKEEKAFEMLLTLPVNRMTIAVAKIVGAVAVSALTTAVYFLGFSYVMASIPGAEQAADASATPLSLQIMVEHLGSGGIVLLVASLGLVLLFSGSLGLLIGVLSGDTRVAGAIAGPIGVVLYIGLVAAQLVGIPLGTESALLGATVYGLPLTIVVSRLTGDATVALLAASAASAVVTATLVVVMRVFESERILIGVSLRRRRRA